MNRRERLMATLRGETVDRPAVSFYELNGLDENPLLEDPYNIYSHPTWAPLISLTQEKTDRIVMRNVSFVDVPPNPLDELTATETFLDDRGSLFTRLSIRAGSQVLSSLTRRDPDVNTTWVVEPLLKGIEDLKVYLDLPLPVPGGSPDIAPVLAAEDALGDSGIVMIDTPDPLCQAAALFEMGTYMVIAFSEPLLFHKLLQRFASVLYPQTEALANALAGRLWRIYGPEYASPPFLPPTLFKEYVVGYDTKLVDLIHGQGGYARIHSHGRLKAILDMIVATGCVGLDPVEPPPQGDVSLRYVRETYGQELVLFGNLEANDIENMPTKDFRQKVLSALAEGASGDGRGFVLMPSACPYGRVLSPLALANYLCIIEVVERLNG